jgi:uncharacterized protein (TIGR03437 family)
LLRKWLFLAALAGRIASGQAPTYSSDSIVNGANYAPGPFAPNSIISIFGENLAFVTAPMPANSGVIPLQLGGVEVNINGLWSPLIYVSPTQINLLLPGYLAPGTATLVVNRQGTYGPSAAISLVPVAPQLFITSDGFVIAQHADYSQITSDAPAQPGEIIIVYAIGLGPVLSLASSAAGAAVLPQSPAPTDTDLQVLLNGSAVASWANGGNQGTSQIQYAGVTPGSAAVYQINLVLPTDLPANPEIQVSAGGQMSTAGVVLPTQPSTN